MVHPWNRWSHHLIEGMTDAQLAVMRGTDRDARQHNVQDLLLHPKNCSQWESYNINNWLDNVVTK